MSRNSIGGADGSGLNVVGSENEVPEDNMHATDEDGGQVNRRSIRLINSAEDVEQEIDNYSESAELQEGFEQQSCEVDNDIVEFRRRYL